MGLDRERPAQRVRERGGYSLCTTSRLMYPMFGRAMYVPHPVGLAARAQDLGVVPEAVE